MRDIKTRIGISESLFAAIFCLCALFAGYFVTFLLIAYVYIVEDSEWLKRITMKALLLMIAFDVIALFPNFIDQICNIISNLWSMFSQTLNFSQLKIMINECYIIIEFIKNVVFIILALKAYFHSNLRIKNLDNIIYKYIKL